MKISACFIVKDDTELPKLRKAVASLVNYVDGIYITANGKEVTQIEKYCKTNAALGFNIHYSYLKWCDDFSKMRNFNFDQAPKDSGFIWWMDTDDILIGGERLQEVAQQAKNNGKDVVFFTYWYGCTFNGEPTPQNLKEVLMEHNRERLLKPGVTTWKKRLHETPVPVDGAKNNYTKYPYDPKERPVVVMHTSEDEELEEKMVRNKRILELELHDERISTQGADPRTLLYLMKIYAELNNKKEWLLVQEMGEEYLTKSGWNEERAACWEQMGIALAKMNRLDEAIQAYHNAISEWPYQPLLYIRLATAYFNQKNYGMAEHWMRMGASLDIDNKGSNLTNMKAMKTMYSELLLKLNWNAHRDTKKALEAAKLLFQELPTKENGEQVMFIEDFDKLNDACGWVDKLCQYLALTDNSNAILPILDALPNGITNMPFAQKIRQQFTSPRKWENNEICYFASFGAKHFEEWDDSSLSKGIGGSETAVIKLAQEWAKAGYKVTVYGDPVLKGERDGVNWLPWYYFNPRDSFNIFIQWRVPQLAGKIKCRKFLVDLHDIFAEVDYKDKLQSVDKIMVKSKYHRSLAPNLPDEKMEVIPNGI